MPEGHTIHRLAEQQSELLVGDRTIVESPQGRFRDEARKLTGRVLRKIVPHGKHLFYCFDGKNNIIHIHLGLYGKYRHFENPPGEPRGAVRIRMIGERNGFDLNGPNRCQLITLKEKDQVIQRLGEDPLKPDANPEIVWDKIKQSRKPIGSLLLDQSVIAGIGNIYRSEILFLCKINPQTEACQLNESQFREIWNLTCELMELGKRLNKIVTRNVKRIQSGRAKTSRERFNIYKKPDCPECGKSIYYWTLANRTVYSCEACQPYLA